MEALKRYRTGGEQKVTVQHVSVSEGGQAIVGNVTQGAAAPAKAPASCRHSPTQKLFQCPTWTHARGGPKFQRRSLQRNEDKPSTQYRANACEPALRRQEPRWQTL